MGLERRRLARGILAAGLAGGLARPALAAFPDRPIRIVVPFAAGGNVDLQCRILAERLTQSLRTSVVVENRTGAGGMIGAEAVARAAPDGHTLLGGSNGPLTVAPAVRTGLSYDPLRDFAPIALTSRVPMVLAVSPRLPARTLAAFLAQARANPERVTVASSGAGSSSHLVIVDLGMASGVSFVHVPYRGASATVPDLVSGAVDALVTEVPNIAAAHQAGQARILAVAAARRSPLAPEVPTFAEAGLPDFLAGSFCGLLAPARTPPDALRTLGTAVAAALAEPDTRRRFEELALEIPEPAEMGAEGFAALLRRELDAARRVAAAARIQVND